MTTEIPKEITEHFNELVGKGRCKLIHLDYQHAIIKIIGLGYFCGYCWLLKVKVPVLWHEYENIHYDLDIHGGITYGEIIGDYIMYGFDCAHYSDDENPLLKDENYILGLCQTMRSEILSAVQKWCKDTREELNKICRETDTKVG